MTYDYEASGMTHEALEYLFRPLQCSQILRGQKSPKKKTMRRPPFFPEIETKKGDQFSAKRRLIQNIYFIVSQKSN